MINYGMNSWLADARLRACANAGRNDMRRPSLLAHSHERREINNND